MILLSLEQIGWAADPLDSWTLRYSSPLTSLGSIAYGNGLFVAIGEAFDSTGQGTGAAILTSPDGTTWTHASYSGTGDFDGGGITYGNGQFVGVWDHSVFLSLDGVTWIAFDSGTTNLLSGVAYGNGQFVAVGAWGTNGVILTSPDGVNWTKQFTARLYPHLSAIDYGNGHFVAAGYNGVIISSPDGVTWTRRLSGVTNAFGVANPIVGIAYGEGRFVAVGWTGTILESGLFPSKATLQPLLLLSDGTVRGSVTGNAGQNYVVQASTNLTDWVSVVILTTTTNATAQFTDPGATNFTRRFYRAVSPSP